MNDKEIKNYKKYLKIRNNKKVNWFNRIRFWKYLQSDYKNQTKEIIRKEENTHNLKLKLKLADELIEQLQNDLSKKKKKQLS